MLGKEKRLNRLFNKSQNIILVPLDHGISCGPIQGLENMRDTLKTIVDCKMDSILLHKGIIEKNYDIVSKKQVGLIMHLSASTNLGDCELQKIRTETVDEAIAMGCDGVSVHVNLGNSKEPYMLEDFSNISGECMRKGMPLIAMMYSRGESIRNELDINNLKHITRVAVELGADIVKINYPENIDEFRSLVEYCQVPVVIAGGEKRDEIDTLKMIDEAMMSGARGISMGRNIFQSNCKKTLISCIQKIVHQGMSFDEVSEEFIKCKEIELFEEKEYLSNFNRR